MTAMLGTMPQDPATDERHLTKADRQIAEAEQRRVRQLELLKRLAAAGHDTTEAERLLDNITDLLVTARAPAPDFASA
jgi:hypothetical protein